jgi:DNA-binding CsgD family transcriptional regulator
MFIDEVTKSDLDRLHLRGELERVLAGRPIQGVPRPEIVESWRRSAARGLHPDRFAPPSHQDVDPASPLLTASAPLVDRLAADLAVTEVSVVLTDDNGIIGIRRVPHLLEAIRLDEVMLAPGYLWAFDYGATNGVSDCLTTRSPSLVRGAEHFYEALTSITTAGAPIYDPGTKQLIGAVALVCSEAAANSLLLPMAIWAAREIEARLSRGRSALDRLLESTFLSARRRIRTPLALVSRDRLLTNAAAARLLEGAEQRCLWELVSSHIGSVPHTGSVLLTAEGRALDVNLEAVFDGPDLAAVLVRFSESRSRMGSRSAHSGRSDGPRFGWDTLTQSEWSVSELVVQGLTNRQVASQLLISPYTVDAHLRHIFKKLDISSRVDLARVVTSRTLAPSSLVA